MSIIACQSVAFSTISTLTRWSFATRVASILASGPSLTSVSTTPEPQEDAASPASALASVDIEVSATLVTGFVSAAGFFIPMSAPVVLPATTSLQGRAPLTPLSSASDNTELSTPSAVKVIAKAPNQCSTEPSAPVQKRPALRSLPINFNTSHGVLLLKNASLMTLEVGADYHPACEMYSPLYGYHRVMTMREIREEHELFLTLDALQGLPATDSLGSTPATLSDRRRARPRGAIPYLFARKNPALRLGMKRRLRYLAQKNLIDANIVMCMMVQRCDDLSLPESWTNLRPQPRRSTCTKLIGHPYNLDSLPISFNSPCANSIAVAFTGDSSATEEKFQLAQFASTTSASYAATARSFWSLLLGWMLPSSSSTLGALPRWLSTTLPRLCASKTLGLDLTALR